MSDSIKNESGDPASKHWTVDKRVPLAMIFTVAVQTFAGIWWLSGLSSRVGYLETQYAALAPQGGQIIRLQTQLEGIDRNILEIKNALMRGQQWQPK